MFYGYLVVSLVCIIFIWEMIYKHLSGGQHWVVTLVSDGLVKYLKSQQWFEMPMKIQNRLKNLFIYFEQIQSHNFPHHVSCLESWLDTYGHNYLCLQFHRLHSLISIGVIYIGLFHSSHL